MFDPVLMLFNAGFVLAGMMIGGALATMSLRSRHITPEEAHDMLAEAMEAREYATQTLQAAAAYYRSASELLSTTVPHGRETNALQIMTRIRRCVSNMAADLNNVSAEATAPDHMNTLSEIATLVNMLELDYKRSSKPTESKD